MSKHEPFGHIRGHLNTVEDTLDTQGGLVEYLRSTADGLATHSIAGLIEEPSQGDVEYDGGEEDHPQTHLDR